ncbi:hypothetical protein QFZ55_007463 [Streptomyces luteogriseus]|nr:hypothetical protein [Streptomyces luteogriseus]
MPLLGDPQRDHRRTPGMSRAFTDVLPPSPTTVEKPLDDMAAQAADDTAQAAQVAAAALADAA